MPNFKVHDWVSYPAHGVGQIIDITQMTIAGTKTRLYVLEYVDRRLTVSIPTKSTDLRRPISKGKVPHLIKKLKGVKRRGRKMWSQRKRDLAAKLYSGDIMQVAEVVRDTYKAFEERSPAEWTMHEQARDMLAREIAASNGGDVQKALALIDDALTNKTR